MARRMPTTERKLSLLNAAATLARKDSFAAISRERIAKEAGVSPALLTMHFGTMDDFRRELMRHAVVTEDLILLAQGIAQRHPIAVRVSRELRLRVKDLIGGKSCSKASFAN